jgi:exosortase
LIPLVCLYLLYQKRSSIFTTQTNLDSRLRGNDNSFLRFRGGSLAIGIPILLMGVLLYIGGLSLNFQLNQNDLTSIIAASAVVVIVGSFILLYGLLAFKAAMFPLLFFILLIPIPSMLMDSMVYFLQVGSTEFTNILFLASGVPFLREGFVFHLPGMSVEVAPQCSGIRSSMALFITALLAGYLFLNTWWKKVILVVFIFPVAMFKNGIRIVTLTLLGTYVDPRILQSSLHKEGGIPFFILALAMMAPILFYLKNSEKRSQEAETSGQDKKISLI